MYVDASALAAILLGEAEREPFLAIISASAVGAVYTGPVSAYEATTAIHRARGVPVTEATRLLFDFLEASVIAIRPVAEAEAHLALAAFHRFGKGRHPAGLNLGDCFSYAMAKAADVPILFKGADFALTDLRPATADPAKHG